MKLLNLYPKFKRCTIEIWEQMIDFIRHFTGYVIILFGFKSTMLVKGPTAQDAHNVADDIF